MPENLQAEPLSPESAIAVRRIQAAQRSHEKASARAKEWLDARNELIRDAVAADPDLTITAIGRAIGVTHQSIRKIVGARA